MEVAKTKCCKQNPATVKKQAGGNGSMSLLSTALLILLPKCPLCLSAYLSAGALFIDMESEQLVPFMTHVKPFLGALIIILILLNRRGRRTLLSLGIATVAMAFLALRVYFGIGLLPDWIIYTAFFFAIWYNGNFRHFFRFVRYGRQ
jgi:hypothetical protein